MPKWLLSLGIGVGSIFGVATGIFNIWASRIVAEDEHEAKTKWIEEQWTKKLVELGKKAQSIVDDCEK